MSERRWHGRTVVVTGATAGIGRATARLFAAAGANVGLLARGEAGLEATAAEAKAAGVGVVAVPTDMADFDAVEAAGRQCEQALGPIEVWVNDAFSSVFAEFCDIAPDEYRRVTEVSYLGFVHGTRVALELMRPRDTGVVVQVGSALGARSIPLQSAYCGAKHAVNGFTSSVRTELMHHKSGIRITVVQMPAVNTPQFSWVLSRLGRHPQPVPPIYQPEVAARAVVHAAAHPRRKQYYVGGTTVATVVAEKFASGLLDRYLARTGYDSQQTDEPVDADRPGNLWAPLDGPAGFDHGARGVFSDRSHTRSLQLRLSQHAPVLWGTGAALAAAAVAGYTRRRNR